MTDAVERIRVLLVAEEPELRDVVATALERTDDRLVVETASSAEDGRAMLADHAVDCIVSDYELPGANGIEFLETARQEYPELPVILSTGTGSEAVAADAISAGVTEYLRRTGGAEQHTVLANRITTLVDASHARQRLAVRNRELGRYEHMLNSMDEAACVYDADGRFELVNEQLARWYDTTREALVGQESHLIPAIRERADGEDPYRALLDGEREQLSGEIAAEFPGHGPAMVEYRLTPLRVDGEIEGVVGVARDVTDRREREERRRQTTARLKALFERSPDMINVHDAAGNIIDPNPRLCEETGYTEAELTGMTVWEIDRTIGPDEARALWRDMAVGDRREVEGEFQRRDGSTFPVEVHIRRLDLDGETRFVVISRDISDRNRRERELERYEAIVEHSEDGIYVFDADGTFAFVNQRVADISGIPQGEWLGEHVSIHAELGTLTADEVAAIEDGIDAIVRGDQEEVSIELEPDVPADLGVLELRLTPFRTGDGTDGVIGFSRDITERNRRERTLRDLQHRTGELIRASTQQEIAEIAVATAHDVLEFPLSGVHLVDDDRELLEPTAVTDEVREHLGGAPTYRRTDPERSVDTHNWEVFEAGETVVIEDTHDSDLVTGSETPSRSGIIIPLGEHGIFVTSSPEPHAFSQSDVALLEIFATIVIAVLDRNEREETLRDRTRRLEAQKDRLEQFASIVSHDLRNPLNVADGWLEIAREEHDSESLGHVDRALTRMDVLIDDLLTLAREGEAATDREPVALGAIAAGSWANVETADATLDAVVERTISADESRLKQIFENLFRNAVEHGGADVTVTIGELADGFYVEDDGPGIPEREWESIFDVGYSTNEVGTGFGLSIVRQVVDAHDWEIAVTEGSEGGARFEITGVEFVAE